MVMSKKSKKKTLDVRRHAACMWDTCFLPKKNSSKHQKKHQKHKKNKIKICSACSTHLILPVWHLNKSKQEIFAEFLTLCQYLAVSHAGKKKIKLEKKIKWQNIFATSTEFKNSKRKLQPMCSEAV